MQIWTIGRDLLRGLIAQASRPAGMDRIRIRVCPGLSRGPLPGLAVLVRSAYALRRGTCYSPGRASLERLGQPAVMVGRRRECALIGAIHGRAAADGVALLRCGEPGAGKTMLLDATADAASAVWARVLRAPGVEFEVRWDAVGVHRLAAGMIAEEWAAWLPAAGACELAASYGAAGRTGGDIPDNLRMGGTR